MPEVKKKIKLFGQDKEVTDVPIVKSTEPWSEYELEDGSIVRFKNVATSIVRVENQYGPDGSPMYLVFSSPVNYVYYSPEKLRKKDSQT
ncbi:MAG: hypothetical protein ACLQGU_08285 [bacterium]